MHKRLQTAIAILRDPGFGFAVCNIIYASKANSVALAGAFFCALAIIGLGALRAQYPHTNTGAVSKWQRHLHDERLSLRLLGAVVLLSSAYTLGGVMLGHYPADMAGLPALQATAGILFGTSNFMLAASLTRKLPPLGRGIAGTFLQAETWMAGGMLCLGLMTGLTALVIFPFVAIGYALALGNIRHNRAEYHGHPKLWYAAATLGFAALSPDGWLVAANLINAACLIAIEHRLTPQGLWPQRQPQERLA